MDYYEFLQISSNAEPETIHRVFRFLAARFHPDNPETGNLEAFTQLKQAYDILSDPDLRAHYDAASKTGTTQSDSYSTSIDFMDDLEGELNRRLAILALLYIRRRTTPDFPEVSLAEVEERMGCPRDYLGFTTWYLRKKGYITREDNSDFALTADGVDFVELQRAKLPILNKLLTGGTRLLEAASNASVAPHGHIIVPAGNSAREEQRQTGEDET
jgi:curved DNA-binding protein CbpA